MTLYIVRKGLPEQREIWREGEGNVCIWVYKFLTNCCCIAFQLVRQSQILCCIYYIIFWYKFYDAACAALAMIYELERKDREGKIERKRGEE